MDVRRQRAPRRGGRARPARRRRRRTQRDPPAAVAEVARRRRPPGRRPAVEPRCPARTRRLGRTSASHRPSAPLLEQQHLDRAAGRLAQAEPGGQHPGVVDDQQVARAGPGPAGRRRCGGPAVAAGAAVDQQAGRVPGLDRHLGDGGRRQVVVEVGEIHGAGKTYRRSLPATVRAGDGRRERATVTGRAIGHQTGPRPGDDVLGGARPDTPRPAASIVVPAHDEEAVIGRLLDSLAEGLDGARLDVVVACNGCTDRTADIARDRGRPRRRGRPSRPRSPPSTPATPPPSAFPRFYVDADVVLTGRPSRDVAAALAEPGVAVPWPRPSAADAAGRPWAVRGFYAVWPAIPYIARPPVGSGVYAMSAGGPGPVRPLPGRRSPTTCSPATLFRRVRAPGRRTPSPFVVQAPWTPCGRSSGAGSGSTPATCRSPPIPTCAGLPGSPGADRAVVAGRG